MGFLNEYSSLIQVICSFCILLVTILYVWFTWKQTQYTKESFLESIKKSKEDRQPYLVPSIKTVKGGAFGTDEYIRIQLNFKYLLENVGDSSAVSVYTLLYARLKNQTTSRLLYAHLIPHYNYSIGVGKRVIDRIHFETKQFRDLVEDLCISYVKNEKRIQIDPSQEAYGGPVIIMRVLYMNMMGQWFESTLEQQILEITKQIEEETKKEQYANNVDIENGDHFRGYMINPSFSKLTRKTVTIEYVKNIFDDCKKNADYSEFISPMD